MAFTFHGDGRCHRCGRQTNDQCDCCTRFVCDEHRFCCPVDDTGYKETVRCEDCAKKNAKPCRNLKHSPCADTNFLHS